MEKLAAKEPRNTKPGWLCLGVVGALSRLGEVEASVFVVNGMIIQSFLLMWAGLHR